MSLMKSICVLISLILIDLLHVSSAQSVVVNTTNGQVEGRQDYTIEKNRTYYAFQGIPFAKPPVDELRFEEPQPTENWVGILSTKVDKSPCIQTLKDEIFGQEDCLYLNVYTPQLSNDANTQLPVMVWIYGGAFEMGTSSYDSAGPDYLLDQDIVFVSLNYRLGVLGFMSLGDLVLPGNNGLKDQNLALKWVQNNIAYFGGDPNNVTLFGQSAGAASVSYHLQSPLSTGLFHRVIMDSGTSYCLWSYSRVAPEIAKQIAQSLEIDVSSSENIVAGLRKIEVSELQNATKSVIKSLSLKHNPRDGPMFAPVIEPKHATAFLSERSYELIKLGNYHQVSVLLGYNSMEGMTNITSLFRLALLKFDATPSLFVPIDMNIRNSVVKDSVGREIKFQYFGLIPVVFSTDNLLMYISEDQFVRPIQKFAKMLSKSSSTYLYQFRYEGGSGGKQNRDYPGVGHSEELGYIFRRNDNANETDSLTRSRMVKLWTNFVKFGNPTPEEDLLLQNQQWKPIDAESKDVDFFVIDYNLTASLNPEKKSMDFWSKLYDRYGIPPYDTY